MELPITENAFKAYCQVLGLNWEDIVEKGLTPEELEKRLIEKTPSMKAEIERFSTQRIAEGNRKRATISSWNFDGNSIYFQVELHYHQIWNTPWGQMTAYQADTRGRGEFNPYDLINIQNAQICVEVPPIIALALNKTNFCVSLAPIADRLFINNNT
ncbi:hypothetical protein G7B40_003510 [Aetokthonos hydrillicola Thurmond2011]|jgi:hypothetical protein|uniref:Uncharacterized protein n=1 Tax=Aetokthonos hydrillicola Thurmond2011 TaxID=2712845 RepID=A0AAP5I2T4_9CYAN|nr:hypothetical protein [Aetokthonos hydrillicola]MBO3462293.1 hypothetical protein [Aetokthonos hydrillicola CCALA 1050]MBW4590805.1 hypothetical protein [Aetokthonos hydrillicola CCALA 1050]MDR9893650.1 hypothetical protein [Aetokthonos hydrillicola Thurmond2011]